MGFLDILKEFAGETTIHGLAYMAQSKQSVFRRLTWALLFVIFLIYSTFQLKTAVDCKLEASLEELSLADFRRIIYKF